MRRVRVATARSILTLVFALFAAFFLIPVSWLMLAPTKTDNALVQSNPFAFGSLPELGTTWHYRDSATDVNQWDKASRRWPWRRAAGRAGKSRVSREPVGM